MPHDVLFAGLIVALTTITIIAAAAIYIALYLREDRLKWVKRYVELHQAVDKAQMDLIRSVFSGGASSDSTQLTSILPKPPHEDFN